MTHRRIGTNFSLTRPLAPNSLETASSCTCKMVSEATMI
jgi:hypothetical protein